MVTQVLTYYANKNVMMADASIMKGFEAVKNHSIGNEQIALLCGTICYRALFLIPEYKLVDRNKYSIENCIFFAPGLLKVSLHDILYSLGDIAGNSNSDKFNCLRNVLSDPMFPEAISLLKINTKDMYCALCTWFANLFGYEDLHFEIERIWNSDSKQVLDAQDAFFKYVLGRDFTEK